MQWQAISNQAEQRSSQKQYVHEAVWGLLGLLVVMQ
jgi:hypothetical protein